MRGAIQKIFLAGESRSVGELHFNGSPQTPSGPLPAGGSAVFGPGKTAFRRSEFFRLTLFDTKMQCALWKMDFVFEAHD
jgi:hypothetical protein